MKNITIIIGLLLFAQNLFAQCINSSQYPLADIVAVNDGSEQLIANNSYSGEFTVLTGLIVGNTYQFDITLNSDDSHGLVTIIDNADGVTLIDYGLSSFAWYATTDEVQIHWNNDYSCSSDTENHTTTYQMQVTPCINSTQFPLSDIVAVNNGSEQLIANDSYAGDYTVLTGLNNGGLYQFDITLNSDDTHGYVTIIDDTDGATVLGSGMSPFIWEATTTAIQLHWNNDINCSTDFENHMTTYTNILKPTNDTCATAITVSCNDIASGTTIGATDAIGNGFADVWYSFTGAGSPENVRLSLCNNTNFNTYITVIDSCDLNLATIVAQDDDGCGNVGGESELTFLSDGITTYFIYIEGFDTTDIGNFELAITCTPFTGPSNNTCSTATSVSCGETILGTTTGATDTTGNGSTDVWYSFTGSGSPESVTLSLCSTATNLDTYIAVIDTCDLGSATLIAEDDDGCGTEFGPSELTFSSDGTTTYLIAVLNFVDSGVNDFQLELNCNTLLLVDINERLFSYYPNPVKNSFSIVAKQSIDTIKIHNILGQEVLKLHPKVLDSTISMEHFESGIYLVTVKIGGNTETFKMVKE